MKNIKKKKRNKPDLSKVLSFVFSLIVVFLIVLMIISNLKIYQRRDDLKSQIARKEIEMEELSEKIKSIKESTENEFDDDYHLEKIAREQLLLKKEGEKVIFVTTPEEKKEEKEEIEKYTWLASVKNTIINKIDNLFNKYF